MSQLEQVVVRAAAAAAAKLPTAAALVPGAPVTDRSALTTFPGAGSALVATLTGEVDGQLVVVVGAAMVEALAASPLGRLDLVPALTPALDSAAVALGHVAIGTVAELAPDLALDALQGGGTVVAVPLVADGEVAALVGVRASVAVPRQAGPGLGARNGLELLRDVEMEITAELGRTRLTVRELLSLAPGAVVELDRAAGSPCDLLVNGTLIARGEVVVVDEDFGIRITEILTPATDAVAGTARNS